MLLLLLMQVSKDYSKFGHLLEQVSEEQSYF
jgi:hypothetical protein